MSVRGHLCFCVLLSLPTEGKTADLSENTNQQQQRWECFPFLLSSVFLYINKSAHYKYFAFQITERPEDMPVLSFTGRKLFLTVCCHFNYM